MTKTIVIVGALDTKGKEFAFVRGLIEQQGIKTLVVDFGVLGEPALHPDIGPNQVAQAGGADLAGLRANGRKDDAMKAMSAGLAAIVRKLHQAGKLDGILGMGGTGGTSITTAAMRALPVGVPKVAAPSMPMPPEPLPGWLRPRIPVIGLDANINDPAFADKAAELVLGIMKD